MLLSPETYAMLNSENQLLTEEMDQHHQILSADQQPTE